jgi:hypothetical protein
MLDRMGNGFLPLRTIKPPWTEIQSGFIEILPRRHQAQMQRRFVEGQGGSMKSAGEYGLAG